VHRAKPHLEIARDGLWTANPGFVQLLGLCPMLAVSNSLVNALGMGLATIAVLVGSNTAISLIRGWVRPEVRIAVFVAVIATFVTIAQLAMQAFAPGLDAALGLFIALIVTNCIIIGRAEAFAARTTPLRAAADGLWMGLGFTFVLVLLGTVREVVGTGHLLVGAELLFGPGAERWAMAVLPPSYPGFLVAVLPPGAFLALGLFVAAKQWLDARAARRAAAPATQPAPAAAPAG
jgi:electron transport complex protein RnfE